MVITGKTEGVKKTLKNYLQWPNLAEIKLRQTVDKNADHTRRLRHSGPARTRADE